MPLRSYTPQPPTYTVATLSTDQAQGDELLSRLSDYEADMVSRSKLLYDILSELNAARLSPDVLVAASNVAPLTTPLQALVDALSRILAVPRYIWDHNAHRFHPQLIQDNRPSTVVVLMPAVHGHSAPNAYHALRLLRNSFPTSAIVILCLAFHAKLHPITIFRPSPAAKTAALHNLFDAIRQAVQIEQRYLPVSSLPALQPRQIHKIGNRILFSSANALPPPKYIYPDVPFWEHDGIISIVQALRELNMSPNLSADHQDADTFIEIGTVTPFSRSNAFISALAMSLQRCGALQAIIENLPPLHSRPFLFHFTEPCNIQSIHTNGLLCVRALDELQIPHSSSSNELSRQLNRAKGLFQYVRLTINQRPRMAFTILAEGRATHLVSVRLSGLITIDPRLDCTFSDTNATANRAQLGKDWRIAYERGDDQAEVLVKCEIPVAYIIDVNERIFQSRI